MSHWRKDPSGREFINPYNFVRLGSSETGGLSQVERRTPEPEGSLSGVINCTMRTRTPLAIPDVEGLPEEQVKGDDHKGLNLPRGVPFFRTPVRLKDGSIVCWPTIPGSEIRGVIRSAFEALDDGCLSVNNSNIASARDPFPYLPAVLEGKWVPDGEGGHAWKGALYVATVSKRCSAGAVKREWPKFENRSQKQEFWFKKGNEINVPNSELTQAVLDYLEVVNLYMQNSEEHKNGGLDNYLVSEPPKNPSESSQEGSWPIYYDIAGSLDESFILYLSPAQITRRVFRNRVDDLLGGDAEGSHKSCQDPAFSCEPCRLFGFVGDKGSLASRIRITDARMQGGSINDCSSRLIGDVTLKELSGPKTSSVEFYTQRPLFNKTAACVWTYDAAIFGYERKHGQMCPKSCRLADGETMQVLGRKFYLHHHEPGTDKEIDRAIIDKASTEDKTKRNMTVELVKSGTDFAFQVYFEDLSEEQLQKLVWTICIGENSIDGSQLHKIGHGKPLGLGSVKIVVDQVWCRSLDEATAEYNLEEKNFGQRPSCQWPKLEIVEDFLAVTNWELTEGAELNVDYPLADDCKGGSNSNASHQWFKANRVLGNKAENEMTTWDIYRTLPPLPGSSQSRNGHPDGSALLLPKLVCNDDNPKKAEYSRQQNRERVFKPRFSGLTKRPKEAAPRAVYESKREESEPTALQKAFARAGKEGKERVTVRLGKENKGMPTIELARQYDKRVCVECPNCSRRGSLTVEKCEELDGVDWKCDKC